MIPPSAPTTSLGAGTTPKIGKFRRRPTSQTTRTPPIEMMPRSVVGLHTALRSLAGFKNHMTITAMGPLMERCTTSRQLPFARLERFGRLLAHSGEDLTLELQVAPGCAHPEASRTLKIDVQD